MDNGIRLRAIGDLDRLPPRVRAPLDALRAESGDNTAMDLTLALSYGGRESLVAATRRAISEAIAGSLRAESFDARRWPG